MLWNDTPGARRLATDWHKKWLKCQARIGRYHDQPALNAALRDTGARLSIFPNKFNAQFKVTPRVIPNASAWHYYYSLNSMPYTAFEILVSDLAQGAKFDHQQVAALVRCSHPWRRSNLIDDYIANSISRRGRFDGWRAAWIKREVIQYSLDKLRRALGSMKRSIIELHARHWN